MSTWDTPRVRWLEWIERDADIEHPVWLSCDEFDERLRSLFERRVFGRGGGWGLPITADGEPMAGFDIRQGLADTLPGLDRMELDSRSRDVESDSPPDESFANTSPDGNFGAGETEALEVALAGGGFDVQLGALSPEYVGTMAPEPTPYNDHTEVVMLDGDPRELGVEGLFIPNLTRLSSATPDPDGDPGSPPPDEAATAVPEPVAVATSNVSTEWFRSAEEWLATDPGTPVSPWASATMDVGQDDAESPAEPTHGGEGSRRSVTLVPVDDGGEAVPAAVVEVETEVRTTAPAEERARPLVSSYRLDLDGEVGMGAHEQPVHFARGTVPASDPQVVRSPAAWRGRSEDEENAEELDTMDIVVEEGEGAEHGTAVDPYWRSGRYTPVVVSEPEPTPELEAPAPGSELAFLQADLPDRGEDVQGEVAASDPSRWPEDLFREHYGAFTRPTHGRLALAEVDFFLAAANLPTGSQVVDIGCGDGAHALALAQRGYRATGLDASRSQLARAQKANDALGSSAMFVLDDMRQPVTKGPFDGALCFGTTLGYFSDEDNVRVVRAMRELLIPGGRIMVQVLNRDAVIARLPTRSWWQGIGCLVLDEAEMNFFANRLRIHRTVVFEDGRQFDHDMWIRAFSAHDLSQLFAECGFRVLEISGSRHTKGHFYGATSPEIWLFAERLSM